MTMTVKMMTKFSYRIRLQMYKDRDLFPKQELIPILVPGWGLRLEVIIIETRGSQT